MKIATFRVGLVGLSLLALTQCGGKDSLSSKIKLEFLPETPVAVNSDFTLNPGQENEREIDGPWYLFGVKVTNNSTNTLYLQTFTITTSGFDNNAPFEVSTQIDPSVTCDVDDMGRAALAEIAPGGVFTGLNLDDPLNPDSLCTSSNIRSTLPPEMWFIDGLPESDMALYSVDVKAEGFFLDDDGLPYERLYLEGGLTTQ